MNEEWKKSVIMEYTKTTDQPIIKQFFGTLLSKRRGCVFRFRTAPFKFKLRFKSIKLTSVSSFLQCYIRGNCMGIKEINNYFKTATRADVNDLLGKIILSVRQTRIFELFYIKDMNIGFIADTLGFSERVISEELNVIREKISAVIQQ